LKINTVATVRSIEEAEKVKKQSDYDVMLIYAANTGRPETLDALLSEGKHHLMFLRHRSGPYYDWHENVHNKFLRRGLQKDQSTGEIKYFSLDEFRYPGGMDVDDCVVDDAQDLLWRLQALYGIKNFIGSRIVAIGGVGGWWCDKSPDVAKDKFKIDIKEVSYGEVEKRIKKAKSDKNILSKVEKWTEKYLSLPHTTLMTDRQFVVNAFLLYTIFKDLMAEYESPAITIRNCMTTVIPIGETTACLPLSLINDEGYMAFCESDFNAVPCGILMRLVSGKPVFLNDPSLPHHGGLCVAAHCTAPRRMDGKNYSPAEMVTHYESDYGVTPKVILDKGQEITMIVPDCSQKYWIGFKGTIDKTTYYDICRSQYDIIINGDWKKFNREHRGFHWMMTLGDCTEKMGYAIRKIGLNWLNVSET
jgi:L-fucose isomerase-like protein